MDSCVEVSHTCFSNRLTSSLCVIVMKNVSLCANARFTPVDGSHLHTFIGADISCKNFFIFASAVLPRNPECLAIADAHVLLTCPRNVRSH